MADGGSEFVVDREPDESIVEAVIRALAAIDGVSASELDPLYDHVEIDALERMTRHAAERDNDLCVVFTAGEYVVTVDGTDRIRIAGESP